MLVLARLLPRLGSQRMVQTGLLGYTFGGPLVGLASSLAALFAALLAWGAFQGILDVAMNTQAVTVERAARRPLMSGFHASWGIGAFAGAVIGALGVAAGLSLTSQLLLLAAPVLLITGGLTTLMMPDPAGPAESAGTQDQPRRMTARLSRPVLVLGAIALASMLCAGAS